VSLVRVAILLPLTGCIIPFAIPPTRGEIGGTTLGGGPAGGDRALHVGSGVHLASVEQRKDLPLDVGIGGFADLLDKGSNVGGVYVDGALFTERGGSSRTSVGARGELRMQDSQYGGGAKLRVDHEWFGAVDDSFSSDTKCGVAVGSHHGNGGVGFYVEAGRVWQADGSAWLATAGLTLRVPGAMGVWFGIPGC